jgi:hypothetical protein
MPMTTKARARALEALTDVPTPNLIAAVGSVMAMRYRKANGLDEDSPVDFERAGLEVDVEEFLEESTVRQLKLLREIALGMTPMSEH